MVEAAQGAVPNGERGRQSMVAAASKALAWIGLPMVAPGLSWGFATSQAVPRSPESVSGGSRALIDVADEPPPWHACDGT